jgi:hypothetical protein
MKQTTSKDKNVWKFTFTSFSHADNFTFSKKNDVLEKLFKSLILHWCVTVISNKKESMKFRACYIAPFWLNQINWFSVCNNTNPQGKRREAVEMDHLLMCLQPTHSNSCIWWHQRITDNSHNPTSLF